MRIIAFTGVLLDEKDQEVGVKGVGKDSMALKMFEDLQRHQVEFASLAGSLKDLMARQYGIDRAHWDTPDMKEVEMCFPKIKSVWSWRKLLEVYGTDVIRDGVQDLLPDLDVDCRKIWLNKICYSIQREQLGKTERLVADTFDLSNFELFDQPRDIVIPRLNVTFKDLHRAVVSLMSTRDMPVPEESDEKVIFITDVRFFNEYAALKHLGATIIQVRRKVHGAKATGHASNQVDRNMMPHFVIDNNGTLNDLAVQARHVLFQMKLL